MTRWLVLLAAGVGFAYAADAGAETRSQKAVEKKAAEKKAPAASDLPLHLYLAKGEVNACGEGCSAWIAVEGRFDPGSAGRAVAFLKRHAARKLPVYFHSPGGSGPDAMAIGRQLRQLGYTVGVGATVPSGCSSVRDTSAACGTAKRAPQPIVADWRPDGTCSSACVWALLGGKVRYVPPSARLGVHSGKLTLKRRWSDGRVQQVAPHEALHKARAAEGVANTRRYMREMGIDTALMDAAQKIPHEDIRYLSRDEIAAFGIDGREFVESPWFFTQFSNGTAYVSKWIVEARGPDRKEYRVSVVMFRCSSPSRAGMQFVRGLASNEIGRAAIAIFSIGKQKLRMPLSGASKRDSIDTGSTFSATAVSPVLLTELEEAAASDPAIRGTEGDPLLDTKLFNVFELSTHGLAASLKPLRERCAAPSPAPS